MKIDVYVRVGSVERGKNYTWRDAYSLNGNTYPWLTKREAQSAAKRAGAKAVFQEARPTTADPAGEPHAR